jgi:hypothetical protein
MLYPPTQKGEEPPFLTEPLAHQSPPGQPDLFQKRNCPIVE